MHNGFPVTDDMRRDTLYNGNCSKFGIRVDGRDYMVKRPEKKGGKLSAFSEYTASGFIRKMGFPAQEVWLGQWRDETVSVIRDFTSLGRLRTFMALSQAGEETDTMAEDYSYDEILRTIRETRLLTSPEKEALLEHFWIMYLCDAILANRDRHADNWGYLLTPRGCVPAPIYDNGASLFPGVGAVLDRMAQDEYAFLRERAETFPASLMQVRRPDGSVRRSNYHQVLGEPCRWPGLEAARARFRLEAVADAIDAVTADAADLMPEAYWRFYPLAQSAPPESEASDGGECAPARLFDYPQILLKFLGFLLGRQRK